MNQAEIKRTLLAWRPGSAARDALVEKALAEARLDPALREWLERHAAFQRQMRASFEEIPVPSGLKDQILARAKIVDPGFWRRSRVSLALAAAAVFLALLTSLFFKTSPESSFSVFRTRMVSTVLRQYSMDIHTNDKAFIRQFLANNQAPSDYSLQPGLERLPALGAGVLRWQSSPVSMVCLESPTQGTLFLFVVDRASLRAPPPTQPEFASVKNLATASWSQGDRAYVLAANGRMDELRKLF